MNSEVKVEELEFKEDLLSLFDSVASEPYCFFLDSGLDPNKLGRHSFLGFNPFLVFRSKGGRIELIREDGPEEIIGDPFDVLKNLLSKHKLENSSLPLVGGAVGYFAYDLGKHTIKDFKSNQLDDINTWDCVLGCYDTILMTDNLEKKSLVISCSEDGRSVDELKRKLNQKKQSKEESSFTVTSDLESNFTKEDYCKAIEEVKDYIQAGDIYQANLSQRFSVEFEGDPWLLYKRLRSINPAPFAAYLNFDDVVVISSSPERFLKVEGDRIETRPIKGTRPRGSTAEEDQKLADELMSSDKDRAEHVMIVDLERNDLGRVCEYGTVKVSEFEILESYPTVHHMVSTVEGRLREGVDQVDILKATFPGGSITGAPKVRSMEIIDELEPTKRSVYTGAIGYLSFNGNLDLNIAIRTILLKDGRAHYQVGGGIVADSDPKQEYQETLDKGRALEEAVMRT